MSSSTELTQTSDSSALGPWTWGALVSQRQDRVAFLLPPGLHVAPRRAVVGLVGAPGFGGVAHLSGVLLLVDVVLLPLSAVAPFAVVLPLAGVDTPVVGVACYIAVVGSVPVAQLPWLHEPLPSCCSQPSPRRIVCVSCHQIELPRHVEAEIAVRPATHGLRKWHTFWNLEVAFSSSGFLSG